MLLQLLHFDLRDVLFFAGLLREFQNVFEDFVLHFDHVVRGEGEAPHLLMQGLIDTRVKSAFGTDGVVAVAIFRPVTVSELALDGSVFNTDANVNYRLLAQDSDLPDMDHWWGHIDNLIPQHPKGCDFALLGTGGNLAVVNRNGPVP